VKGYYFFIKLQLQTQVIMRKIRVKILLFTVILATGFYSCTKTADDFTGVDGSLPTNYIIIKDNSFAPSYLVVSSGSSITFVNDTDAEHSIVSEDSATILSGVIQSKTSFYFKKDTVGTIQYHCGLHPTVKGTITLRP